MKLLATTACAACLAVAGVIAQEPNSAAPPTSSTPQTSQTQQAPPSSSASTMTVTGCIERASQVSPSASTDVGSQDFVLIKPAAAAAGSTAGGSGAAGTTGTSGRTNQVVLYRLSSADASKLTPHVGHKVELTGMLDSSAAAAKPSGTAEAGGSTNSAPAMKVDSVKMIAATCSE